MKRIDKRDEKFNYFAIPGLKNKVQFGMHGPVYYTDILAVVAEYYDMTPKEVLTKRGNGKNSEPRMLAIYLMLTIGRMTLKSIGDILKKDHTTIIYCRDKITNQIEMYDDVRKALFSCANRLR